MPWLKYTPGPIEFWLAEALTQFVNGFLSGWRHGVGTGAATGVFTGTTDVAQNLTAWQQVLVSAGSTIFSMIISGINQASEWHKTNPVPNPWSKPTGNTQPPMPTP